MTSRDSNSPKSRNTTILFITIFSLLLIFSYYLFVYVPSHEDKMHEQHIRVLNKISQNIKTKMGGTLSNARNIAKYSIDIVCKDSLSEKIEPCVKQLKQSESAFQQFEKSLQKHTAYYNKNIAFRDISFTPNADTASIYIQEIEFGKPGILISDSLTNIPEPLHYHLSISAEDLIANLLRFDHFEQFALFSPGGVLYESHPTGTSVNFDSLYNAKKTINTIHYKEVVYGGISHVAYFRPININSENRWVLAGFVSSENLANQKYSLSPLFSIILLLLLILTILSIPFIKIKIMHVREHLTVREVAFSFISATLITSILILLISLGYTYWSIDKPEIETGLKRISNEITADLNEEITNVIALLNDTDIEQALTQNSGDVDLLSITDNNVLVNSVENLFGIKAEGIQHEPKLSIVGTPTPTINISKRDYYRKAKNNIMLCAEGFKLNDDCFYLESIISLNTGKQLAAVSITNMKDEAIAVNAAAGRFHSIIETLLPPGYGFAIIDKRGHVLFHNDSNRNLQENLFEEIDDPDLLRANMLGTGGTVIKTKYHDRSAFLYSAAMQDWPISLITYYDNSLLNIKYLEIFTLFLTIYTTVCLALLVIFGMGFIIEKWGTAFWETSKQESILSLNNIAPQKNKKSAYRELTLTNAILLPLFIIWCFFEQTGIAVLVGTFLICLQYWALRYFFSNTSSNRFWMARFFELTSVCIGAALVLSLVFNGGGLRIFLYLALAVLVFGTFAFGYFYHCRGYFKNRGILRKRSQWAHRLPFVTEHTSYLQFYGVSMFLSSLSLSLVLTVFVYRASYLQETETMQKYELTQFERGLMSQEKEKVSYFYSLQRNPIITNRNLDALADYRIAECKGIYRGNIARSREIQSPSLAKHAFFPLLYQIPLKKQLFNAPVYTSPNDPDQNWHYTNNEIAKRNIRSGCKQFAGSQALALKRAAFWGGIPGYMLLFIIMILLFAAAGHAMIRLIIRQLFVIKTPENFQFNAGSFEGNLKRLKSLLASDRKKSFYIVTLPLQFREILKKFNPKDYKRVSWTDLSDDDLLPNNVSPNSKKKPLVITDLEFSDGDGAINTEIIKRLKKSVEEDVFIVLVSKYDPLDLLQKAKNRPTKEAGFEHNSLAGLLAEFDTYYFPLTSDTVEKYQSDKQEEELLVKERSIYYELWNSLTPEEKYVLLDLSQDGLVNTRNLPAIHRLFKKGLITSNNNKFTKHGTKFITSLQVFNNHFRRYIDKLAETEDLKELEEEINATGTWRRFRTPLLITLTGILVFIFITQQETYGEIVGILASVAASLPILLKVLNTVVTRNKSVDPA